MSAPQSSAKISLRQIVQRFRIVRDRPRTLREAFTRRFHLGSSIHTLEALKGISFSIAAGESLGIIGRNGSGKSTILRIIARIYRPTAGSVEVNGHVSPLIELGAGFHPELTGRENVVLAGALLGIEPAEMRKRMEAILGFAELTEFANAPVKQYSSGMFTRLAFAVATEIDPDILLVDEILAVGDEAFQRKCMERMNHLRREGKTIVFVSHDMNATRMLCDRVLVLEKGEIVAEGSPEAAITAYHKLLESSPPASAARPT